MAANPRQVINTVDVTWDGGVLHVLEGTIVDIPAGHPLETAYGGSGNLLNLSAQQALSISNGAAPDAGGSGT
jgi:hypothetical protein